MTDSRPIDHELAELTARTGRLVFGILWTPDRPFLVVESNPDEVELPIEP